jgi:hypothetical protein
MLAWLNLWQRIPVSEIKEAQHLEQAKTVSPEKFIARQHPQKTSNWPILQVAGNAVYWGKVSEHEVRRRRFYRTDKRGIETALCGLPEKHAQEWQQHAKAILSTYFDQLDGQLVRIKQLTCQDVTITQEGHYCWRYQVGLEAQSTGLHAPVEQQTRLFELCLSGETFQEMTLKELEG